MKTGKVKQVAAFGKLVGICNDLGASYNPSKAAIKPTALTSLLKQAQQSVEAVNGAHAAFTLAVNTRKESFSDLNRLVARVVRALSATEVSSEHIQDAKLLKRKLVPQSKRKKLKSPDETNNTDTRSTSRVDFDGRIETFAKLIQLIKGLPSYAPNEVELQVPTLEAKLGALRTSTNQVVTLDNKLRTVRMGSNKLLYSKTGLTGVAFRVKDYIRSVFGVKSDVASQIGKIKLVSLNKV
jgi:hypothetical protein